MTHEQRNEQVQKAIQLIKQALNHPKGNRYIAVREPLQQAISLLQAQQSETSD